MSAVATPVARTSAGDYVEKCPRCGGSGRYGGPSTRGSDCFKCHGTGKLVFKSSPEARARAAERLARRAQAAKEANWTSWAASNEPEAAWIDANTSSNDFASSMRQAVIRWGSLTDRQLAAVRKWMVSAEDRKAQQAVAELTAPAVDLPAVEQAFSNALARGIRNPKLTLAGFTLSPAKATSQNAGAIYVKQGRGFDGTYLGKVMGGRFLRANACNQETEQAVLLAMRDPQAAAIAYGKEFGKCAVCARDLTDSDSIARGIGPVCAERMGW